jgi:uncharacterized protein (TIRG00374 family)
MPVRRAYVLAFGAILGALFLFFAVRTVDWRAFAAAISRASLRELALGGGCLLACFWVKALRWRCLVAPFAQARARDLLPAVLAGLAGNYVFPHAGEIPRAVLAGLRLGAAPGALLGSIAVERFFDFLALLVIVLVLLPFGGAGDDVRIASLAVAGLCAAILAAVVLFVVRTDACLRLARGLLEPVSRRLAESAAHHLGQARTGLAAIQAPRLLLPIFGLSALQWILIAGCVAFSLRAVGAPVTAASAAAVLLLNVIGLTLPAAPGHVGTVQLAFIVGLAPFGVPQEAALAGSVVYNFLMVAPAVVLGFPGLRRAGAQLRERLLAR